MSLSRSDRSTLAFTLFALVGAGPAVAEPTEPQRRANLAGVRMPFVANAGQVDARVAYYAPTFAGTVFVTRQGEVVYALPGTRGESGQARGRRPPGSVSVRLQPSRGCDTRPARRPSWRRLGPRSA